MKNRSLALAFSTLILFSSAPALAGPAAIVEEISGSNSKIQFMDFLSPGKSFDLGSKGTAVLGYMQSCLKETITGGKVTVGAQQSKVSGGTVKRLRVECDGGQMLLTSEQAGKSAVTVFRKAPNNRKAKLPKAKLTLYSTAPILSLSEKSSSVQLVRLDKKSQPQSISISGNVTDLAGRSIDLAPGGLYRLSAGKKELVFKVDPLADSNAASILQRLIRL